MNLIQQPPSEIFQHGRRVDTKEMLQIFTLLTNIVRESAFSVERADNPADKAL